MRLWTPDSDIVVPAVLLAVLTGEPNCWTIGHLSGADVGRKTDCSGPELISERCGPIRLKFCRD